MEVPYSTTQTERQKYQTNKQNLTLILYQLSPQRDPKVSIYYNESFIFFNSKSKSGGKLMTTSYIHE